MEDLLGRFSEELQARLNYHIPRYNVKVSQTDGSFFLLVRRRPRRRNLVGDRTYICKTVQITSQNTYRKYAFNCIEFQYKYFPYFKLVRCFGDNQYHFLVVRKNYI